MLDLVYLALVVAPLTLAALALLLMVLRSFRTHSDARAQRRRAEVERARTQPGGMRRRDQPLVAPPSIARLGDVRELGRSVVASLANDPQPARRSRPAPPDLDELSALVESLARSPIEQLPPRPHVGAPPAETKRCPDCAEEILAAARVCKHCRCRFDEPGTALTG
jgi:hypothetical protein